LSPFKDQLSNTDEELISRFKETGNNFFMGELYKRYTHLVFGLCMKYLKDEDASKDMVMDIFEKILLRIHKEEISFFKSWLYIVAKNECLMKLRKADYTVQIENVSGALMENGEGVHLNEEENKEAVLRALEKGVQMLNDNQKKCIELFYLQQRSYQEVADHTGFSLNEVKSHIQNGKRNLKNYLSNND
jgi:RNA polymerase sigma factor (sigma-70 family)